MMVHVTMQRWNDDGYTRLYNCEQRLQLENLKEDCDDCGIYSDCENWHFVTVHFINCELDCLNNLHEE